MKKWNNHKIVSKNRDFTQINIPVPEDCEDWKVGVRQ